MGQSDEIHDAEQAMFDTLVAGTPQIKVAMLISRVCDICELPDSFVIDAALDRLVRRQDIQSFGDIRNWPRSEIIRHSIAID